MSFDILIHPEIIRGKSPKPQQTIKVDDPRIRTSGQTWRGTILIRNMEPETALPLLALTEKGGWMEIDFQQPTTAIGVQFWGDRNDGWVRILVDGVEPEKNQVWSGNTVGERSTYEDYVEIRGLSHGKHTLRIEATGEKGRDGGDVHVTVAAFGWGPIPVPRGVQEEFDSEGTVKVFTTTGVRAVSRSIHFEILRGQNPTPKHTIKTDHPWVRTSGEIWRGNFQAISDDPDSQFPLLALVEKESWVEVTFEEPTTAVGVQFWGDSNDGWAKILLDGTDPEQHLVWAGNTVGSISTPFEDYIEIRNLPRDKHVLRIMATGEVGRAGGDIHVTMAAFGWDPINTTRRTTTTNIFLPIIRNNNG